MAQQGGMNIGEILLIGVGGYLLYSWLTAPAAAAPTTITAAIPPATTAPATTAPATTPPATTPPATTPPATTPPATAAATGKVSLAGPVTPNINNSLSANVNVNGTITNVTIIKSNGRAYNTSGVDVTASLTAAGVNVPQLLQMMQAQCALTNCNPSGTSGLSWYGMGLVPRRWPVRPVGQPLNYVPWGTPMRRIG